MENPSVKEFRSPTPPNWRKLCEELVEASGNAGRMDGLALWEALLDRTRTLLSQPHPGSVDLSDKESLLPTPAQEVQFVVLQCWYDGDSNLVDDTFRGVATTLESAVEIAKGHANGSPVAIFMPGEPVPDDGCYGDKRFRYRVIPVRVDRINDQPLTNPGKVL